MYSIGPKVIRKKSVKGSKWLQMITLVGKVFVLLLIAFFGIYNLAIGKYTALENAFEGSSSNAGKPRRHWSALLGPHKSVQSSILISGDYAVGFYTCMFSFAGWQMICKCYDELKNPKVDMPIIITCKCLYLPAITSIVFALVHRLGTGLNWTFPDRFAVNFKSLVQPQFYFVECYIFLSILLILPR